MATAPLNDDAAGGDGAVVDDDAAAGGAVDDAGGQQGGDNASGAVVDTAADAGAATDWRSDLAGEDADLLRFLGRYQSQGAALAAWKKDRDDIRSGKFRKPLGADPTEDELAAYRKDYGIPDKPEGYLTALPDGLVVGDADKPLVNKFVQAMHGSNAPKAAVDAALSTYYDIVDEQVAAQVEANTGARRETEDALREEWGPEYRRNLNVLSSFIGAMPETVGKAFLESVDATGVQIANKPDVMKWLMSVALEQNPVATVVPGAGANQASAIAEEIAALEDFMGKNRNAWFKDDAKQARYQTLLAARDKLG